MSQPISFRTRLAQNTAASVATNVWTIALILGTLPVILRGLGTESFGIWVLLQTFSATTGWLSIPANGLSVATTREIAMASTGDEHALGRAAGATLAAFAVAGIAFGVVLAATGPAILRGILDLDGFDPDTLRILSLAFGVQVLAEHLCLALTSVLEGLQRVALARGIDALRKTVTAVAVAVVATSGGGLRGAGIASAAAGLGVTFVAALMLARTRRLTPRRPGRGGIRSVVRYAGTVSVLQGTGVLHRTMDRTIVGVVFGPTAVAVVEIANQIQVGSTALLSATTYPMLSSGPWLRARGDDEALRALLSRLTRYSVLLTVPLVALIIAFAGPFLRIWVGTDFSEAIGLTQVAVISVALSAPLQAGSNLLQGIGKAGAVLRAAAAAVVVNLIASIVLVHVVGIVGVFIGTTLSTLVLIPMLVASIDRHTGASTLALALDALRRAVPPAAAAGAVGFLAVSSSAPDPLALGVGGAAAVGAAVAVAARWSLDPGERAELMRSLRRGPAG